MLWKECIKKIINNEKICLIFIFILCMFSFSCRRCSSVVEHVIGNDGVASPILASGTIFENAPFEVLFCMYSKPFFCMYSKPFRESDFIDFEISDF